MSSATPTCDDPESITGVRTHCPFCAYQCGMILSPAGSAPGDGARLPLKVIGDAEFLVNRGQMCIKGWNAAALLEHPDRLTSPLVRGPDGRLIPAEWGEALDRVAAEFLRLRDRHGPEALGVFGSGALTNEKAYLLGKFARVALRTPHVDYNGRYCMSSAAAAGNRAFGIDRGLPFPVSDIAEAEVVLLAGSNLADTLPPIMQWFEKQKRAGGRLIVADPRRTPTARVADLHLQLAPGSDLALANGLLYVALEEQLLDRAFIADRTTGFEAVQRVALTYYPARVERLTGIAEGDLRRTVRWLASARSAMVLSGRGTEQQSKGVDGVLAFINLMLALGKVGKPASGYGCLTGQGNGQGGREHGQKADQLPGYRLIEVDAHREAIAGVWGIDPADLPRKGRSAYELLDSLGRPGGVRGLLVMGSNVVVASPHAGHVEARLRSLDFLVVCEAFLGETARLAHVVLPVTQWAEEEGTLTNFEGRVIRRRAASLPPRGVRGDIDVLRELAHRLGRGEKFDFDGPREVFEEFRRATAGGVADYAGITYGRIDREGGVFWPCPSEDHPGTPRLFAERFHHPDGRARFHPVEHRAAGEEPDEKYPYYLTTGRYKEHYNSGAQTRMIGALEQAQPLPRLQIHSRLARRLGVAAGGRVLVESRRGKVVFEAEVTAAVRPDTVFAPFHWGGARAVNQLTNPALDPISRMPEFKIAAVRLEADRGDGKAAT